MAEWPETDSYDIAVEEMLGDFRLDAVPDDQQVIAQMFYDFAHKLNDMVPNGPRMFAGLNELAKARGYFIAGYAERENNV